MLAPLLLAGSILAPVALHRVRGEQFYCAPGAVCSFSTGYCPKPYFNVVVNNEASSTYGNEELEVTVTRFGYPQTPNSPVYYYLQWVNPTNHPLLIKGPWMGAFGTCLK